MTRKILGILFIILSTFLYGENKLSIGIGISDSNVNKFFRGDSDINFYPMLDIRYENFFVNGFDVGYDFINRDDLTFSLFVNPFDGFSVKPSKMDDGYDSIDRRKQQIAGGAKLSYNLNSYHTWISTSVVGGEHGAKGNVRISQPFAIVHNVMLFSSIGANVYSKDYTDYYWGIDRHELGGNIMETYSPDVGYSSTLQLAAEYYFNESLTLMTFMSAEKFSDEIKKSPIIDDGTLIRMGAGIRFQF